MSKVLSIPVVNIDDFMATFTARLAEIHHRLQPVRIGYEHPHLSMAQIKHVLLVCLSQLYFPKYMQYSAHDVQIANMWEFLGHKDWQTIPYASSVAFELSYDALCIEVLLRVTEDLEKHLTDFHHCFGVRVSANGKAFALETPPEHPDVYVPREDDKAKKAKETTMRGDFVKYDSFVKIMTQRSFNKEGYSADVVNRNCKREYIP